MGSTQQKIALKSRVPHGKQGQKKLATSAKLRFNLLTVYFEDTFTLNETNPKRMLQRRNQD